MRDWKNGSLLAHLIVPFGSIQQYRPVYQHQQQYVNVVRPGKVCKCNVKICIEKNGTVKCADKESFFGPSSGSKSYFLIKVSFLYNDFFSYLSLHVSNLILWHLSHLPFNIF